MARQKQVNGPISATHTLRRVGQFSWTWLELEWKTKGADETRLRLHDLAAAQAAGADTHPLVAVGGFRMHGTKINVPAPLGNVVGMTDLISCKRLLAANFTNLCHR